MNDSRLIYLCYAKKYLIKILFTFSVFNFLACNTHPSSAINKTVYINKIKDKYILYRNGAPFLIKGASGYTNLKALTEAGGNTIRTWDTTNLAGILKDADLNHLAVIVCLSMPDNEDPNMFYNNQVKVKQLYQSYSAIINKHKNSPSLLFWCVGNELSFPFKPKYNNFYKTFNALVDMIHHDDPNHPVTTTMINFQRKNIFNIKLRTNIDLISFNIFGDLHNLKTALQDFQWFWDGPFLVTEWGVDGPWAETEKTSWAAYIENTSTKKAEQYLSIYKNYMPFDNPRFLGSLVFYWGQKQECTPTWFSMFDENGASSAAVGVMQYIWTAKWPQHQAPNIKYMLVDNKGAKDDVFIKPNTMAHAKLFMANTDTAGLSYKWYVEPEDWYRINNKKNEMKIKAIEHLIFWNKEPSVSFRAPTVEGAYRLYVAVYDKYNNFSTANTPFYIVGNNENE